jgi:hypothetical protein
VVQQIRAETDSVCLAFSCGKDSVLAWLALRPHFARIVPIWKYQVPGLEFVEAGLRYFEGFFGTPILRLPHPSLLRMLKYNVFQPPGRWEVLDELGVEEPTHEEIRDLACRKAGLPPGTWIAIGTRAADNPQRRLNFLRQGPIRPKITSFYPVWDVRKKELIATLKDAGCRLPSEYRCFGRSWDGLDFRFLWPIRRYFPRDYRRILEWFPLAELECFRYESRCRRLGIPP